MKYAREVMELMAAFPGREFKVAGIVRYVTSGRALTLREGRSARKAVLRVLESLEGTGAVKRRPAEARGSSANYAWAECETRTA